VCIELTPKDTQVVERCMQRKGREKCVPESTTLSIP